MELVRDSLEQPRCGCFVLEGCEEVDMRGQYAEGSWKLLECVVDHVIGYKAAYSESQSKT